MTLLSHALDCCGYCRSEDSEDEGIPRGLSCRNVPYVRAPMLTMQWAAGLSFHRCHADYNVPVDPHLEWIFTGEEVNRAARLWTHGYDLYLPSRHVILHNYSAAKQAFRTHTGHDDRMAMKARSLQRLRYLLGLPLDAPPTPAPDNFDGFGAGRQRKMDDFIKWSRIDTMQSRCNVESDSHCTGDGRLERVPVADLKGLTESASVPLSVETNEL